jgi:hypothetical protein
MERETRLELATPTLARSCADEAKFPKSLEFLRKRKDTECAVFIRIESIRSVQIGTALVPPSPRPGSFFGR